MSDSFADLWNTSVPQKKKHEKLATLAQNTHPQRRTQPDLFSLLAAPSPSTTRSTTPAPSPPPPQQKPSTTDAFADLLSTSSFASSPSTQNLSIAQRAALADKQRQQALQTQPRRQEEDKSPWAGLDSLGGSGLVPSASPVTQPKPVNALLDDDDWGLEDFGRPSATPPAPANDDWDLETFGSQSQSGPSKPAAAAVPKPSRTLWDFDGLASAPAKHHDAPLRIDSPSNDFDFGNREDDLLNGNAREIDNAEDDFMSVFDKPKPTSSPRPPQQRSPALPTTSTSTTRNTSPPPHLLGQIVEMGFSIPRAKAALAANDNNVQAALDQLLSSSSTPNGGGSSSSNRATTPSPPIVIHPDASGGAIPRRRDREIQRDREREREQRRRDNNNASPAGSGAGSSDIQAQAEQLFAQASEIGRGVFTKASLFWKEKREQVQKVVGEQVVGVRGSGSNSPSIGATGKPKWMQEAAAVDEERTPPRRGGFKDDDGEGDDEPTVRIPRRLDRQRDRERAREREAAVSPQQPPQPEVDLFALSEPIEQQPIRTSPRPHGKSIRPPLQSAKAPTSSRRPNKISRELTPIPSMIASLKAEANATFKLGQFGNAETLYTRAIDAMNGKGHHVYFVLLLNNRASARMKTGDVSGAVRDCESVVRLVCENELRLSDEFEFESLGGGKGGVGGEIEKINWEPSLDGENGDGKVQVSVEGAASTEVVDLGEGLMKAIKRRAEAFEGMEKWGKAKRDWECLRNIGWVRDSVRSEAGRGMSRCEKTLGGGGSSLQTNPTARPVPKPKPKPTPQSRSSSTKPSEALRALRDTNAQVEAEDLAKHALKDRVDTKLANWKSGKETNVRALLASLDLVLWEEVSSAKVGMHELVTPAQVKVKYMRAVAKVHPDKLNANNSTLEQRMIAQGVFGALNEAWNAFKQ